MANINNSAPSNFKADEHLDENANIGQILAPSQPKQVAHRGLRRTGPKSPQVVLDVYMGVLEANPRVTELN